MSKLGILPGMTAYFCGINQTLNGVCEGALLLTRIAARTQMLGSDPRELKL